MTIKKLSERVQRFLIEREHQAHEEANRIWHERWNDRAAIRRAVNCPWPMK